MDRPREIKWVVAVCGYVVMIFAFAMLPGAGNFPQQRIPHHLTELLQNLLHIPLYAGLGWLLLRAVRDQNPNLSLGQAGVIIAAAVTISLADEFVQSFIPGRTASVMDVGLDLLGVLLIAIATRLRGSFC